MTVKSIIFTAALALAALPALAQQVPQPVPDPAIQALGQMLQEAQGREAQAIARAYRAEAQAKLLTDHLAAEKKRADEAEAKLPNPDTPKP